MTRADSMVRMYGEACSYSLASRLLHYSPERIHSMVRDGRLRAACEGERVDVRSIAAYIEKPAAAEEVGRLERAKRRNGTNWSV